MPIDRAALRRSLLEQRAAFVATPGAAAAAEALAAHLAAVLDALEPGLLGIYWPMRSEFNAATALAADRATAALQLALPFARRTPRSMAYRRWDGTPPTSRDECGLPSADGAEVVPDVVLAPCVGFTTDGFRLGYGGGYFDRWLAAYPAVTAVGIAWSVGALAPDAFAPEPHDRPLTLVVTEHGVVS